MMRWHIAYHPFHYMMWAVEEKKSKRLVGMINYHRRDLRERRVEVGWLIGAGHAGQGLHDRGRRGRCCAT